MGSVEQTAVRQVPVLEQPACFLHVTALQAGTDGEWVSKAFGHMLGYICGYGSLLAHTTSLTRE